MWAAEAVRHGYSLLWQAGVLLLILAGIHLLSASLPASAPIIGVALLALLTLIRVVLHRPAASESAARADEEFDGKALMATALECLQRPVNAEDFAPAIVLRQAREAAVQWRPKVSKLFRTPKSGTGVLAMIPVFIAIMLLSLPGADVDRDLPEDMKQPTMSGPGDQDEDIVADAGGIAAIRRALTDDKAPEGRRAVGLGRCPPPGLRARTARARSAEGSCAGGARSRTPPVRAEPCRTTWRRSLPGASKCCTCLRLAPRSADRGGLRCCRSD